MMRAVINRPTGQRRDASAKGLTVTECCNRLGVDCDTWQYSALKSAGACLVCH